MRKDGDLRTREVVDDTRISDSFSELGRMIVDYVKCGNNVHHAI